MRKKINILLTLILCLVLVGCSISTNDVTASKEKLIPTEAEKVEEKVIPEDIEITISGVGDIMVHGPQLKAQFNSHTKEYQFENNFQYIKPYLQDTDLMLGNLETTFGGEERGYSSYPMFNTPDSLADALKDAGFHAIATSNNHSLDTGIEGILRTLEVLRGKGLHTFGTRHNTDEDGFVVMEVKGVKVGLSSYTYETPKWGEYRTINAIKIPKDVEPLIDTFGYENLQADLRVMEERVEKMKRQGAEVVVFYIHWGNEYQREPNQYQRQIAQALSNFGVDIIFGSHPHVVQPITVIESQTKDHKTAVIYSMGNFLSNQRYEILKNRYTEDGVIVNVKMKKLGATNEITLEGITYVPTWVHRYFIGGKAVYEILPTHNASAEPTMYGINSENSRWRVENSHQNTVTIIESEGEGIRPILFTRN